ncbi:MAG: LuxR C-terminal-related transcriptional regulator [Acutalibacteraceae bacterium]|nr:LuxR C-terminal-related transcriptional regulator [Acutalibacteraceae bacterium]
MVTILTEPAYSESMWCKALYLSLTERLRQKRIPFCEMYDTVPQNSEAVFIIAANYNWIKATLCGLNLSGIKPILICNQAETILGCNYSCVCSDITGSMKYLLDNLKADGKTRLALYGVNTSSISDMGRVDGIFAQSDGIIDSAQIFTNEGSLQSCYKKFTDEADNFDAVICFNDFAAVSLIRHLESEEKSDTLNRLKILSCCQTKISSCYRDKIISINMNFEQYGKAAVFIYEKLKAHPYISQMTLNISWNTESQGSANSLPITLKTAQNSDSIYSDKELNEMICAERILEIASVTDKTIIAALSGGKSVTEIAAACFLTDSGVKYRIKRILEKCRMSNKSELISIVKRYLPDYGKNP